MSGQVKRLSLRAGVLSLLPKQTAARVDDGKFGWLWRRARNFVAKGLLNEANRVGAADPRCIQKHIERLEQAWTLTRDPKTAIQLATSYDLVNRNEDALTLLRQAFRIDPRHPLVRHHAAITLLRHGTAADIGDFFASVLATDPDDAFAQFVTSLIDSYDVWVEELVSSIDRQRDGRRPFIISCPVWGQPFADNFAHYICAALLSPNNLPELAKRYSVHIVVFTTVETENHLAADPLFARLTDYAAVRFVRYTEKQINYNKQMQAHYGQEQVFYSQRSLAFYYARNCKFALMSCAHYVALAAGRMTDALVSCQVADTMLNNGALTAMAARLEGEADAVLINCLQMDGKVLRGVLDRRFRRADGALLISSEDCARILVEHLPDYNFVDAGELPRTRLQNLLAGRSRRHSHPWQPLSSDLPAAEGIRPPAAADASIQSTADSSIAPRSKWTGSTSSRMPASSGCRWRMMRCPSSWSMEGHLFRSPIVAFWLWGYWGRLRGTFFRSPLRFGSATSGDEWARAEAAASAVVNSIVNQVAQLEESHQAGKSWRL